MATIQCTKSCIYWNLRGQRGAITFVSQNVVERELYYKKKMNRSIIGKLWTWWKWNALRALAAVICGISLKEIKFGNLCFGLRDNS